MNDMAAAAFAEETERLLRTFAAETDELEREVSASAAVQWESPAADAFRHGLSATVQGLPGASSQLRTAAYELLQDPLMLATGS